MRWIDSILAAMEISLEIKTMATDHLDKEHPQGHHESGNDSMALNKNNVWNTVTQSDWSRKWLALLLVKHLNYFIIIILIIINNNYNINNKNDTNNDNNNEDD